MSAAVLSKETRLFYALSWFAVICLLALWSFAAWTFHAAGAWAVAQAGVLAGSPGAGDTLGVPAWLAPWMPPELMALFTSMLSAVTPGIGATLEGAPALAGGLSATVWWVWGVGAAVLILLGLMLSAAIAMLRRRAPSWHHRATP